MGGEGLSFSMISMKSLWQSEHDVVCEGRERRLLQLWHQNTAIEEGEGASIWKV